MIFVRDIVALNHPVSPPVSGPTIYMWVPEGTVGDVETIQIASLAGHKKFSLKTHTILYS